MTPRLLTLLLLVLTAALSSCARDQPTPKHTRAWLQQADGDALTFRNASTGATQRMLVRVQDLTQEVAGKFDLKSHELQTITLTYTGQADPHAGLVLRFSGEGDVNITPLAWTGMYSRVAHIETHRKTHKEFVYGTEYATAEKLDQHHLHNRLYSRLAHVHFLTNGPASPNTLEEFWYSKDDGLVAYTDTNGQTWHRVW